MSSCAFCEIVAGRAEASVIRSWDDAIAIKPLNPVIGGHTLVIPRQHVESFYSSLDVSAATMRHAAELGHGMEKWEPFGEDANIITSVGPLATQTVKHLHVHVVPRRHGDGLRLPWATEHPRSVNERLLSLEAVAHEPQPMFNVEDFQALASRVAKLEAAAAVWAGEQP